MNNLKFLVSLLSIFLLVSGCGRNNNDEQIEPVIRPVKTIKLNGEIGADIRRFPAQIYASKRAEMAFRVAGKVIELKVKEGDIVNQGDVLARLDPSDFKLAVNDRQAQFQSDKSNYERGKKLVKDGYISKVDYDQLESQFKSSRAALNRAKNDLSYTTLKAPFKGRVAKRYIEIHEEVLKKQEVFSIQSKDNLDVKFNVPEVFILRIRGKRENLSVEEKKANPFVFALFPGKNAKSTRRYPLLFKEVATRADEQTRTFEITFTMESPRDITVLPGMTAEVDIDLSAIHDKEAGTFMIPLSVVFADPKGKDKKMVWVVKEDMTLQSREVETGLITNNKIEILHGLQGNERLVSAGVHYVKEGQKVRLFDGNF
jgi:RND family efflux transporter MFP subunit